MAKFESECSGCDEEDTLETFFAVFPILKLGNPFTSVRKLLTNAWKEDTKSSYDVETSINSCSCWQQRLSLFFMIVLRYLRLPLAAIGRAVELTANTVVVNGGIFITIYRFILSAVFLFRRGPLIVPAKDSADYKTIIGLMDPRTQLFVDSSDEGKQHSDDATSTIFPGDDYGNRRTADVLVLAAKLAYENAAMVEKVLTESWKMHLVGFYNCWNEFQQKRGTQVIVFTDKREDPSAVVVAWRGTEPFNADDWSTDVDFSWYELKGVGRVHIGFLEALGLVDRRDLKSFSRLRQKNDELNEVHAVDSQSSASGLVQDVIDAPDKLLAYDHITTVVKDILGKYPNAKLFITGHSLGGALTALYSGMLFYNKEKVVTDKIAAVYTFGQPRVGNEDFAKFMVSSLVPLSRYYRVVYCNDLVARVPFDNDTFGFKHWGFCYYFNSIYLAETLQEAPNKNYFYITDLVIVHLNAVWELVNSLFLRFGYGAEFSESTVSILFRMIGLLVPGVGGHNPVNYVNAIRLGNPSPWIAEVGERRESFDKTLHELEVMVRRNMYNLCQIVRSRVTRKDFSHAHVD